MQQEKTEAVTTYLECFYRNLHQIQTIQANYFTVPQILNQFIQGLHSSIFQHVCPLHPADFQAAVTYTRDFEAVELEANHVQAMNLVMNGLSDLNPKLKQFKDATFNNLEVKQKQPLINNILPATITKDKSLTTIFSFELKKPVEILLFSKVALESKPITAIYTDAKVEEQHIKLILDSRLAGSIITQQLMDQLGY
ncbi:hypothetical protein G9A89_012729 [Geosiphon pyriformis]|nr:hypothetical protein G9A89_012729 [Geosiphon pyriformis]